MFEYHHVTESPPSEWLRLRLEQGDRLGYDPWLHTIESVERLQAVCGKAGATLVPVAENLVDRIWEDQPPPPRGPIVPHDLKHAGRPAPDKQREIGELLARDGVDAVVLTAPDAVAWLLNIRGSDVAHTPIPLVFAVAHRDATVDLFVDPAKITPGLVEHLGESVRVLAPDELGHALDRLGGARRTVQTDPSSTAAWIIQRLDGSRRDGDPDCRSLPSPQGPEERCGTRRGSQRPREGRRRSHPLLRLAGRGGLDGCVTEVSAADALDAFRADESLFRDVSFPTISGAGPNGAIVHYRATARTDRRIESGKLYLVDSGAQYLDGTTDVTRTVAIGTPTAEQRDRFTRSSGATSRSRWRASRREPRAPSSMPWPAHRSGTPAWTSTTARATESAAIYRFTKARSGSRRWGNGVALRPGMILSNEPGYYKTGEYGIRIESLVVVTPSRRRPAARSPSTASRP